MWYSLDSDEQMPFHPPFFFFTISGDFKQRAVMNINLGLMGHYYKLYHECMWILMGVICSLSTQEMTPHLINKNRLLKPIISV